MVAHESLETSRTWCVDETGFHHVSVARAETWKVAMADWLPGTPSYPVTLPGTAVMPGTSSCRRVNAPALTTNGSQVPLRPGSPGRCACTRTAPAGWFAVSARYTVRVPLHTPLARLTVAGSTRPRPWLVSCSSDTGPW